eukprot:1608218-Pyramimonas_sp.AAC.1
MDTSSSPDHQTCRLGGSDISPKTPQVYDPRSLSAVQTYSDGMGVECGLRRRAVHTCPGNFQ